MKFSFRSTLIVLTLVLGLLSTGIMTYFTLSLFQKEKIDLLFDHELSNTRRFSQHLENLIHLASIMDLTKASESFDVLFLFEDPCDRQVTLRGATSRIYRQQFESSGAASSQSIASIWLDSLEVYRACLQMRSLPANQRIPLLVATDIQIMVPTLLVLLPLNGKNRLALISMEGFDTTSNHTLFLTNENAKILWSADGEAYVEGAMKDTGIQQSDLHQSIQQALTQGSYINWTGNQGLLSATPVSFNTVSIGLNSKWVMASMAYRPAVLLGLHFTIRQMMVLALAILFLIIFLGKKGAEILAGPFLHLQQSAQKIGSGDFQVQLKDSQVDEVSSVYSAFNVMAQKISDLITQTRKKAELESELSLAQQVQKLLFPPVHIKAAGHRIYSFAQSAELVSGDWWGYLTVYRPKKRPLLLLLIGDVTDHGAPSALIAATVKGATTLLSHWIHENPEAASDPAMVLHYMNTVVHDAARTNLMMTMLACVFDFEKQELHCSNAGHTFPYHLRGEKVTSIPISGKTLGQGPNLPSLHIETLSWQKGDRFFAYSDGLTSAVLIQKDEGSENNPKEKSPYGRKDLIAFLKISAQIPATEFIRRMLAQREKIIEGARETDDITAVLCEATGEWDD